MATSKEELKIATHLEDLNIQRLSIDTLVNPVIVVHAPRGAGSTSVIASLLSQLPNLNGVVVLSDRATASYMNGIVPHQLIINKPADRVLKQLLYVQSHFMRTFPGEAVPHIALALDDVMYTPKLLKSEEFQRDVKLAKDHNISILISTTDVHLLPLNVHTFATHVFVTKCLTTDEPKQIHKRMFGIVTQSELEDLSNLCRPYEFLVGLLRNPTACSRTIESMTRTFVSKPKSELKPLEITSLLIDKLSLALDKL